MNGSVLLDTNVIIKMLNKDSAAIRIVENITNPYTSIIVVGELYFAALNSGRPKANLEIFRDTWSNMEVIFIDEAVAKSYAEIRLTLKKKGRPIPDNDRDCRLCLHKGILACQFRRSFQGNSPD